MSEQSVGILAEWIIKHRKGGAYKDNTFAEVLSDIDNRIRNASIIYIFEDSENDFTGLLTFTCNMEDKKFHIHNMIVTKHTAIATFCKYFETYWPGYTITARRKDNFIEYNTNRLVHLLKKGAK